MKKLLILLLITLTLGLSGCERETIMPNVDDTRYYTQDEVDEMLQELEQRLEELESE